MQLFISYRRKSWAFTQYMVDQLTQKVDAQIFIDLKSIDEIDFEHSILKHLQASDGVLLIVSEYTFDPTRIADSGDWVRREIRVALELNKPIVLVCIEGLMPPPGLPEDIRSIERCQGIKFYPD